MSILWGGPPPTNQPNIKVHSLVARECLTTTGPTTDSLLKLPTRLSLETKVSTRSPCFWNAVVPLWLPGRFCLLKGNPRMESSQLLPPLFSWGSPALILSWCVCTRCLVLLVWLQRILFPFLVWGVLLCVCVCYRCQWLILPQKACHKHVNTYRRDICNSFAL